MRYQIAAWLRRLADRIYYSSWPEFVPCAFVNEDMKITEVLLRDCQTVWTPVPGLKPHTVDLGYDTEGNLVGVQIWQDVIKRPDNS